MDSSLCLGVALHTDSYKLQSKLSDGVTQEEQDAIRFVIQRMTEEYLVPIASTAEDVTINERTHQGDLNAEFEQDWSNLVESRPTLLLVDNDMGEFTVSKQSNILADDKEPSSELGSIP